MLLQRLSLLALLLLLVFLVSACGQKAEKSMEGLPESVKQEDYPNLESRLFELTVAKNPVQYAEEHGLYYKEGKVRVEIMLKSSDEPLPIGYAIEVESQYEEFVQALVPLPELRRLSNEPQIKSVRTPLEPWPDRR